MNVSQLLTKSARAFPDKDAVIFGARRWTYAEFDARANQVANGLVELGLKPGSNVALLMYNCPQMMEALFGCFKAGCAAVPINFRLHPNEYAYIIDHSEAEALVTSPEFSRQIVQMAAEIPRCRHLISLDSQVEGHLFYEDLVGRQSTILSDHEADPEDVAWLFYTSGTTGRSKGAMLTHRNLMAMTMSFYVGMCPGFSNREAVLHAAPLSHGSGLYALPNVGMAATNVILEEKSFASTVVLRSIEEHGITNMFVAPTMLKLLTDDPQLGSCDLTSMRSFIYGGGPMMVDDLARALERLGNRLVQLYGQGESPMTITYLSHDDHLLDGQEGPPKRLASAGRPHPNLEVRIVDREDNELAAGQLGEIVTRSDLVMKGYWRDEEATAASLKNGWLHTGDMGYLDDRGYLFIMDRSKDMIISGGENIYPREIEEIIVTMPGVREVAVIGIPDPKWGEAVHAVVSLVPGASLTGHEIIGFCRDNIASYKKPKSVEFVDELPKNNYGKIVKKDLRDRHWQGQGRKV
jgi:acyl-CoA synthetase (AMP-forming)/AMP-acid ligase II